MKKNFTSFKTFRDHTLLFVFFFQFFKLIGQGNGCDLLKLSVSLQTGTNCCYKLTVDNGTVDNCFGQITLNISPDEFENIVGLNNYQVGASSGEEFSIRPRVGFIPKGTTDIATFCVRGRPTSKIIANWINSCTNANCSQLITLNACPWNGTITGVKYVDIGCRGIPYSNQPTLKEWPIELYNQNGQIIDQTSTDINGRYTFSRLRPQNYYIKEAILPGWNPSNPKSASYDNITLGLDKTLELNFGNCKTDCSCDSIYYTIQQVEEINDTLCYYISYTSSQELCFSKLEVVVDSGMLVDFSPVSLLNCCPKIPDCCWPPLKKPNTQTIIIENGSKTLPIQNDVILKLRIIGGKKHKISIRPLISDDDMSTTCKKSFIFNSPIFRDSVCCPKGSKLGTNLICNGNFSVINPLSINPPYCIMSDYTYFPTKAIGPISYTVGNAATASTVNGNNWVCIGLNGPTDNFMIVDGGGRGLNIWKQDNIIVKPNTDYTFSMWMKCIDRFDPRGIPSIRAEFNGIIFGNLMAPWGSPWTKLEKCWNSGNNTKLNIAITLNQDIGDNDFAIDSISLKECSRPISCKCAPWSTFIYRPNSGVMNQTVNCGDTLTSICNSANPISISGSYQCMGDSCRNSPIFWNLIKLGQQLLSGSENGSPFTINIPGNNFSTAGLYNLSIYTICGSDTCRCNFYVSVNCCLEEFEDELLNTSGQWQANNGSVNVIKDISKIPPSQVLCGRDNSNASWMYNTTEYSGNWIQKYGNNTCICFDIKYDNGNSSNPATGTSTLNIYQGTFPSGPHAVFVVNNPIGNSWSRVCIPIGLESGGILPSNSDGYWLLQSGNFNSIIQNVTGIAFALDFAGGDHPSEKLYVDNFCIEKCVIQDTCVCGPWDLLYANGRGLLHKVFCGDTLKLDFDNSPFQFHPSFSCLGNSCLTDSVAWEIMGPNNFFISSNGPRPTHNLNFPQLTNSFTQTGYYCMNLFGICNSKRCNECKIYFYKEVKDCCGSKEKFCKNIMNNVSLSADNDNCKAIINIGNYTTCDSITQISWGDNTSDNNTFGAGSMIMHNYSNPGNYVISYMAKEWDLSVHPPKLCFEKIITDSIFLFCHKPKDSCACNLFTGLEFQNSNWTTIGHGVRCGDSINLPCLYQLTPNLFIFHGDLNCTKKDCISDSIKWIIHGMSNGALIITASGSVSANSIDPYSSHFDLNMDISWFKPDIPYMITVTGMCGTKICSCKVNFMFERCPPGYCPNNLIPNPSFELYNTCPNALSQLSYTQSWTLPTTGTADFYHACSNGNVWCWVPNNLFGMESAHSGDAYAGIYVKAWYPFREYIQAPISSPLVANKKYQLSYFVSLADRSKKAIGTLGAYFSPSFVNQPIITNLNVSPQIQNSATNYLQSKKGWTNVTGTFTATGNEQYIIIGNFNDDANTPEIQVSGGDIDGAYYYIDDICLVEMPTGTTDTEINLGLQIIPNPNNGSFSIRFPEPTKSNEILEILDLNGKKVKEYKLSESLSSFNIYEHRLTPGVYIIKVRDQNQIKSITKFIKY